MGGELRILATFFHDYRYGKVIGGVERRFIELSKAYKKMGVSMYAVEYEPSLGRVFGAGYISLPVDHPRTKGFLGELLKLLKLSIYVLMACRRYQCGVLYASSSVYLNVLPAYIASRICRLPLVIVFHSYPYARMEAPLSSLKTSIRNGKSVRSSLVQMIIEYFRNRAYKGASICFTVSNSTRLELLKGFRPKAICTSGNGISKEWFANILNERRYDACYVGRLSPRKGIDFLLQVWKQVVLERPSATLLIIGGGESQSYMNTCRKITDELNIGRNVIFAGFLDDENLRASLSSSRLFITASTREGFGLTIIEAMALRVPCVLPMLPALRENFSHCAVFVDGRDPRKWAQVVLKILKDGKALKQLSDVAYDFSKKYSWDAVADKEVREIKKLFNSNRT
jgi:glycosyltransferase involved in cell wall biosynthesis